MTRWSTETFYDSEITLYDAIMLIHVRKICTNQKKCTKLIECTTPIVNPNVNYALWVIMMCQSVLTHGPLSFGMLIMGEAMYVWGRGGGYYTNFPILIGPGKQNVA